MKYIFNKTRLLTLLILCLWLFLWQIPCSANIVYPGFGGINPYFFVLLGWAIGPFIEAFLITNMLKPGIVKTGSHLFRSIVVLNLITVPITQIIVLFLTYYEIVFFYAEIFPLVIESLILFNIFGSLNKKGFIDKPPSTGYTVFLIVLANFVTFILGVVFVYSRMR